MPAKDDMALPYFRILSITLVVVASCLSHLPLLSNAQEAGTATYYTPPYTPSACYGYEEQGTMIAAASDEIWNDGGACGQMYQVTCVSGTNEGTPYPCWGSGTVEIKIVDHCPAGCRGTIDLSQEAFASIADPDSGVINISYQQYVPYIIHIIRSIHLL
ncbi:Barwin-related endoglucanase [Theobroma cacao]|uniref:Barwin-related endoglucanase n=1 Tax=Theobroma cacao TaxID=3641 RepID=A0A061GI94_THECC|nr:Barwin-related endoglucanase [Theobroma cacao]